MKIIGLILIAMTIMFFLLDSIGRDVRDELDKIRTPYKEMLNKKVVFEKDTLKVIDYHVLTDKIILSNGKEVALEYAKLNLIK